MQTKPRRLRKSKVKQERVYGQTAIIRTLAYERFPHILPDVAGSKIHGLKSLVPLALQCDKCCLLVAVLPERGIDYLIGMSYFMQNKRAIQEHGDYRRLCAWCQLELWSDYLSIIESDDARRHAREQTLYIDKHLY